MKPKKIPPIDVTKEQREWLESEAKRTGSTLTGVVRTLIQRELEKGK